MRVGRCRAYYSGIAQLVEHLTVNQGVDGSSPPTGVNMESCPSWPKEHDWKSCKRVITCFKGSNPSFSVWPVGQVVKTPPFHGGNMGSNPVRVTFYYRGMEQSGSSSGS